MLAVQPRTRAGPRGQVHVGPGLGLRGTAWGETAEPGVGRDLCPGFLVFGVFVPNGSLVLPPHSLSSQPRVGGRGRGCRWRPALPLAGCVTLDKGPNFPSLFLIGRGGPRPPPVGSLSEEARRARSWKVSAPGSSPQGGPASLGNFPSPTSLTPGDGREWPGVPRHSGCPGLSLRSSLPILVSVHSLLHGGHLKRAPAGTGDAGPGSPELSRRGGHPLGAAPPARSAPRPTARGPARPLP